MPRKESRRRQHLAAVSFGVQVISETSLAARNFNTSTGSLMGNVLPVAWVICKHSEFYRKKALSADQGVARLEDSFLAAHA